MHQKNKSNSKNDDNLPQGAAQKVSSEDEEIDGAAHMSFLDHLEDLRWTLIKSAIAILAGCCVFMGFVFKFQEMLQWPLRFAAPQVAESLITIKPLAVISVLFQVSLVGGFAAALPFVLFFISQFIAPGLTKREKAILKPAFTLVFVLFILGALFSFFVLLPTSIKFMYFLNAQFQFEVQWTADSYFSLLFWMVLSIGMSFEFPLVVILLVYMKIFTTAQLRVYRPHAFVIFLILAAFVTPTTDPITFLILAVPMYLLYETAILVGNRIEMKAMNKIRQEEEEENKQSNGDLEIDDNLAG